MYPRRFSVTFAGVTGVAVSAMGQCTPSWSGYAGPMLDNGVYAVTSWDPDGPGPALPVVVAGGNFEHIGASPLSFVGRWDGGAWLPMGPGVSGTVLCATVWDPDGFGPDPARPFIGGFFSQSAGTTLNCIGWFDGAGWQPLGSGFGGVPVLPSVSSMVGEGMGLVASGVFATAGGQPAHEIARWNGGAWLPFTNDLFAFDALAMHADVLHAGGGFSMPGAPQIAVVRWI